MEEMRELITVDNFHRGLVVFCIAWVVACLLVGIIGRLTGRRRWLGMAIAWAALGPILYGMWQYYSWMVRVEPETGYVGLHKVRVMLINLVVFVALGSALGYGYGRMHRRRGKE